MTADDQPSLADPRDPFHLPPSPRDAITWALRWPGDEGQVTTAVAALAAADTRFCREFVKLLLHTARAEARKDEVERFLRGGIPQELSCRSEQNVRGSTNVVLGRVDLRFDAPDFALFVENKLYAPYGPRQLSRYSEALEVLPPVTRTGLLAINRTLPAGREPLDDRRWLGAVRWPRLYERGLAKLPIKDPALRSQWKSLLAVLLDQGDLGMVKVDRRLVNSWANYIDGRQQIALLLEQTARPAIERVRALAKQRYARKYGLTEDEVASFVTKAGQPIIENMYAVELRFRIPALVVKAPLKVEIGNWQGYPEVNFWVREWEQPETRQIARAKRTLEKAGYEDTGQGYEYSEPLDPILNLRDPSLALRRRIDKQLEVMLGSGILDYEVDLTATKSRKGPDRLRKLPPAVEL